MGDKDWKPEKSSRGIKAFTRTIKGSNFREFKVEMQIDASIDSLIAMQRDVKNHPSWNDGVAKAKLLKEEEDSYCVHVVANAPWPVKDRDSAVCNIIKREEHSATISFRSDNDLAPIQKGCERVRSVEGSWQFDELENGKVQIVYIAHIDPGGNIPSLVANKFAIDVPFNTVKAITKAVKKYA